MDAGIISGSIYPNPFSTLTDSKDIAYQFAVQDPNNRNNFTCNFCGKVTKGGAFRLKRHLVGGLRGVSDCAKVPDHAKVQVELYMKNKQSMKDNSRMRRMMEEVDEYDEDEEDDCIVTSMKRGVARDKEELRNNACKEIARWFYDAWLPFNAATYDSFHIAMEAVAQFGPGFKPPSMYELRVPLLKKEVEDTEGNIKNYNNEWAIKGKEMVRTILSDGFWRNVAYALKLTGPLVKVLRIVDEDKKPAMGYIYEAMDTLKETISTFFSNKEVHYRKAFEIIDRRLVPDLRIQDAIADELDLYQKEARMFGDPIAILHRKEPATNFVYVDDDLTWAAVDIASGSSEPAYPTRASTSRGSVQGSTSAPKGKGTAHTSISSSKAYGLIDEDYEEDIGLFEDDRVNEELRIDVDDDEDDEDDY
nr:hypothetical protein [Tanacetum cinerariifolium]